MTDRKAKQTPLPDLLDQVPDDIVLGIPGDEPVFPSYTNIPIGRLARDAAAELRRLHEAHDWQYKMAGERLRRIENLEAQRDALLEALKKAVKNGCATVYTNEDDECGERGCCGVVSYKLHADDCWVTTGCAAIKAVEEEA